MFKSRTFTPPPGDLSCNFAHLLQAVSTRYQTAVLGVFAPDVWSFFVMFELGEIQLQGEKKRKRSLTGGQGFTEHVQNVKIYLLNVACDHLGVCAKDM